MEKNKSEELELINQIKELEQRNSYLDLISSSIQEMIFIIRKDLVLEYVNSFAANVLNSTTNKVIGEKTIDLFPPEIAKNRIFSYYLSLKPELSYKP